MIETMKTKMCFHLNFGNQIIKVKNWTFIFSINLHLLL